MKKIREQKELRDWYECEVIYQNLEQEEIESSCIMDEEELHQRANAILKFKGKFGYDYKKKRLKIVNSNINYNFIHPDALYYWMIETPVVLYWTTPFDFALYSEDSKSIFPYKS